MKALGISPGFSCGTMMTQLREHQHHVLLRVELGHDNGLHANKDAEAHEGGNAEHVGDEQEADSHVVERAKASASYRMLVELISQPP